MFSPDGLLPGSQVSGSPGAAVDQERAVAGSVCLQTTASPYLQNGTLPPPPHGLPQPQMHWGPSRIRDNPCSSSTPRALRWAASHLGIPQTCDVGVQVKLNSLGCSGKCHSSNQQDHQHEVRESGCEVDHLAPAQERQGESEEGAHWNSPVEEWGLT